MAVNPETPALPAARALFTRRFRARMFSQAEYLARIVREALSRAASPGEKQSVRL